MCMNYIATRKATNVTLDSAAILEAKELGINISQACESGLRAEIAKRKANQWRKDNQESVNACNDWVRKNGLPLDGRRQF